MSVSSIVGTSTQREYNRQLEQIYLDKLFDIIEPGVEFSASYKSMAEKTAVPANIVSNVMKMLDKQGVLRRRFEYYGHKVGTPEAGGRKAYWTIITSKEHAESLLNRYQSNLRGSKSHTNGNQAPIDTGNILAQSKAWVDKCRTYMKGADLISDNLAALKAAGIVVDEEAYLNAINMPHDERLSAIALVMPYIEALESSKRRRPNA